MTEKILLIGIGCVTMKYAPAALRRAGYEAVVLGNIQQFSGESRTALRTCASHQTDIEDPGSVTSLLAERPEILAGVVAVTSLWDEKFPLVEQAADTHHISGPDRAISLLSQKAVVNRTIPEYCPRGSIIHRRSIADADLTAIAASPSGSVLKPSLSAGALGQAYFPSADVSIDEVRAAIDTSELPDADTQEWIHQERINGDLFSLEGFVEQGAITFLGFSQRMRVGLTEVGNAFPADVSLSPAARQRCRDSVTTLVHRSDLRNGYFHCEYLVAGDESYLIDANIGRIGGGTIVEQIALAYHVDPVEIMEHVVLLPLGRSIRAPSYDSSGPLTQTMAFWYGLESGGTVLGTVPPSDSVCTHTQFAEPGGLVPAIGTSDRAWVGMLTGPYEDAIRDIEHVKIETNSGWVKPFHTRIGG
ncbi:hypothetical protein [Actinomadura craniellae]|uniref:hypothetical protein n=1 Tax=Actinomadura craniellae TaxID=2231787 RepID=UPI001314E51F|nr:hypothetical protein [Actinomadura craniellae]